MCFLSTSIKIQTMELKNCLVMPPMVVPKAGENGKTTSKTFDYYTEKSAGRYTGLVIVEHTYINPEGKASKGRLSISENNDIGELERLVSLAHKNGTKVMAQTNHAGGAATPDITGSGRPSTSVVRISEGNSAVPEGNLTIPLPKGVNLTDIRKMVNDFTKAALRIKAAGFDGAEIRSVHGYLLNQFYSPLTNERINEYIGDTIRGRMRLRLETIQVIHEAVGKDYPITLRLGACDYMTSGGTIESSVPAVQEFVEAGIDPIDISGGLCGYTNPTSHKQGYSDGLSKTIEDTVSIPVILTGGITGVEAAGMLLEQKRADLTDVRRVILEGSEWAKRVMKP